MSEVTEQVSVEARLGRVDRLDLEPIVYKLTHADPGERELTLAEADQAVALYRCFLKLCALCPGTPIVPTRQLDRVWHAHMLDTAKYRADCDDVFGRFVDHFPYAGLRGEADQESWRADFERTRRLFAAHFGIDIGRQAAASACHNHGDGSDCCVGCIKPPDGDTRPRPDRAAPARPAAESAREPGDGAAAADPGNAAAGCSKTAHSGRNIDD